MQPLETGETWPTGARILSHEEARAEQRLYWTRKSVPERLAAMAELTRRMQRMRGIALDERKADGQSDFGPIRICRRSR